MKNKHDEEIDNLLNDFDFKPITNGLGFHHSLKEKKNIEMDLKHKSSMLKDDLEDRASRLKNKSITSNQVSQHVNMGDLSPFYNNEPLSKPVEETVALSESYVEDIEEFHSASVVSRFFAWSIDLILITALLLLAITGVLLTSEMPLEIINVFMLSTDLIMSFFVISALFYIFYFSFFDKTFYSTPGKRMMGIRVKSLSKNKNTTLFQSFMRTSLSLCTLGVMNIFFLQDKITNTEVVKV